jgi:hypothetical protein
MGVILAGIAGAAAYYLYSQMSEVKKLIWSIK